jgi:hypothetical protein
MFGALMILFLLWEGRLDPTEYWAKIFYDHEKHTANRNMEHSKEDKVFLDPIAKASVLPAPSETSPSNLFPQRGPQSLPQLTFPQVVPWTHCFLSIQEEFNKHREEFKEQKTNNVESGLDGANTAKSSKMNMIHSSKTYRKVLEPDYLAPLPWTCTDESFLNWKKHIWEKAQWRRQWQNWVRSLGKMWGSTLPMASRAGDSTPAFPKNSEEWRITTWEKNNRKPYLSVSTKKTMTKLYHMLPSNRI